MLVERTSHPEDTAVRVGNVLIGGGHFALMAGPCAVESREQILETAAAVKAAGAHVLRGGAFKPRTSPYDFQGLEEEGLRLLAQAGSAQGMPIVSEITDPRQIGLLQQADLLQVGARNMQNFQLLKELGRQQKPVLLKRGLSATLRELLLSAEYILQGGCCQVILCERGIRTFSDMTRNTLDLSAVPLLKQLTHLPVIVDPSHGTGMASLVEPMALAAGAAGADGLMIEVHPDPCCALSDKEQALTPAQFAALCEKLAALRQVLA